MRAAFTIAQRDFKSFFGTPVGWIAACVIFLGSGLVFYIVTGNILMQGQSVDPVNEILGALVGFSNYLNIFIVPIFTMRVMSEDLATGSYRLQAVAPVTSGDVVLGKFMGVMMYFAVIAALMLVYPAFVFIFSEPDFKVMGAGWLGYLLNVAAIVSIGLFIGSLTKNAVISYLGSMSLIIALLFSGFIQGMPEGLKKVVNLLELGNEFTKGTINTASVSVFLAFVAIFLFLSRMIVENRRWRV